jgi:xylitol oxidase
MKKRTFIKKGGTLMLGGTFFSFCSTPDKKQMPAEITEARMNWAGNLQYSTDSFYQPESLEELQELVRINDKIRPLGTKHCFNSIADSKFNQASVRQFERMLSIDRDKMTATVDAGASYGQFCTELYEKGFALHNLASLPHISVAGAVATATHGSGVNNGNLGTAVSAIEFIDAQGTVQYLSREQNKEQFGGVITHLGALGVITKLTLDLQPAYEVQQTVYQYLPVNNLLANFKEVMSRGYSVSLFTDYQLDTVNQVWIKSKVGETSVSIPDEYYGARKADRNLHPIVELSAVNCTEQMGVPGPWYDRLPHFKMDFTPSSGKELQSEFFVPMAHAAEAFEVIQSLKDKIGPVLMISEIRSIAADDQWMSPFYQQDSVAFHFTWEQDKAGVAAVLPLIQDGLEPFGVKPHWGKVFTIEPERLQSLYPNLSRFKEVVAKYDSNGKFRNEFLDRLLYS